MGVGNGGFAGSIQGRTGDMPQRFASDMPLPAPIPAIRNTGGAWAIGHPEKLIDFAYRATHEMTLKSKQIVKAFYDQSPKYSYFKGCSTGGRMAVMEAQRYPNDYDGIIAGALANRHIHMWTAGFARGLELARHPEGTFSAEKAALVNQMVTSHLRHPEGRISQQSAAMQSGLLQVALPGGKDDNTCLTAAQLKTVDTFYGGVKNSKGELILLRAGPRQSHRRPTRQPLRAGGTFDLVRITYNDPNYDWQKFDLDKDMPIMDKTIGYVDAVNPDLGKFKSSGGKLLLYHGWSDTSITPETTIWYYDSVLEQDGQEPEQLDAPLHGAGNGSLRRRCRA